MSFYSSLEYSGLWHGSISDADRTLSTGADSADIEPGAALTKQTGRETEEVVGMDATSRNLLAVWLTAIVVFSVFAGVTFLSGGAAAANNSTPRFEVVDAGNAGGGVYVTVEAQTEKSVTNFEFTYDNLDGGTTKGPVDLGTTGVDATYTDTNGNTQDFNAGDELNSSTGGNGRVTFTFTKSATGFAYENDRFRVNATGYDGSYATADPANRSVLTANYYRVKADDHTGNALSNIPLLLYNADTNESQGFAFMQGTATQFHCTGVDVSGTCTNPDTNAAGTLRQGYDTTVTDPLGVKAFSLSEANASDLVEPTAGVNTLTADTPTAPTFMFWRSAGQGSPPNVDNITVVNEASGNTIYQSTNVGGETRVPVLLETNTEYTVSLENGSSFGTENRSLTLPTKGMKNVEFRIATGSPSLSTVTGQVVDESGNPVSDVVVTAQPEYASGSRIVVYNATTTDSNGLFTMTVPQTSQELEYSFRLIGTDTSGGTPVYYPTVDTNDGEGYVASSSRTVLPPMTIQEGGRVLIDVTNNTGGKLPVSSAFASLSQESTAYPQTERTALSNTFSTFEFGTTLPTSASISLMSPTTGTDTNVGYNVWGFGNTPSKWVCANNVSVKTGSDTSSACGLAEAGYLNISLTNYGSIIQQNNARQASVKGFGFFYENELLVRNATTNNVVTHLGPDGIQQAFLKSGPNTDPSFVKIPVPAGDYTVELRPSQEFIDRTSVNETSAYTVTSGSSTSVKLDRGRDFDIRPVFNRLSPTLTRDSGNTLAVQVLDPVTDSELSDTDISVEAQLLHLNGTVASTPTTLSYNSNNKSFDTTTFDPKAKGVDAGRYRIAINATHTSGSRSYTTRITRPVQVAGFDTSLRLGSRSVAPGNSLSGQINAYDGSTAIDTDASNVEIIVYDENGQVVSETTPSGGLSNGAGSFSVSMPDTPGRYQVATKITSGGSQGIAVRWVQVSEVDLDVSTNKDAYTPSDPVRATVTATNATDGSAITDATVTLMINEKRLTRTTDSNGEVSVKLDPSTYATGGTWQRGHPIFVEMAQETETGVTRKRTSTFFEVRSFSASAEPTNESFGSTESAVLEVTVPTGVTVNQVAVTELDGERTFIGGNTSASAVTKVADGVYTLDLGQRAIGEHLADVTIATANNGTEEVTTPFSVRDYSVSASLSSRSVDAGQSVTVDVAVRNSGDGSVVTGEDVNVTLNATSPVRQIDSNSATTDSNGEVSLSVSSSTGGPHYVEVEVGQQTRRLGLLVSDVDAQFENSSGNAVSSYQAEPGTTETIYVGANKSGSAVEDGSTVEAVVITRDGAVSLGSATTSSGTASIDFQIPSSVPVGEYSLIAEVTAGNSSGVARGTLNVTGAKAKEITAQTNRSKFSPGQTVEFSSTVTKGDGTAITNEKVDFVVQTDGSADERVATVTTNADGVATYNHTLSSSVSNGEYVLKAALNTSQSIQAFSGYRVSSIDVEVQAEDGPFNPGDDVSVTVYANDTATDNAVTATGGTVTLALDGSNVDVPFSPSGSAAPYTVTVSIPDDSSVTGTRTIAATVQKDRDSDSDSTLIDIEDASETANLSVAEPITAGSATTVTVNGSVDETAVLTAYSPGSGSVAYNSSVTVSSTSDTQKSMTIDSPGTYVVSLSVPSVGELTEVINVEPAAGQPTISTGTDLSSTTTNFTTSEDIYIMTNQTGLTATVVTENESYSVALDQQDGSGTNYGVLSEDRTSGVYLVRLNSEQATNINNKIIEVEP